MENILIVEDEPKVSQFIRNGLIESGFSAEIAYDGIYGRDMFFNGNYDLIILDINLPRLNGFELSSSIRKSNSSVPVLMLTAMSTTDDKVAGFESGADDYLVKPFEFRELLVRIKALLKRSGPVEKNNCILKVADLELNTETKVAKRDDMEIELTSKEFNLLEFLMKNKGRVISRNEIAEKIWDINFDTGTNIIDVYINFLRRKIDKKHSNKLIHTQIGMGYVLKDRE